MALQAMRVAGRAKAAGVAASWVYAPSRLQCSGQKRLLTCSRLLRLRSEAGDLPPHVQDRLFRHRMPDGYHQKVTRDAAATLRKSRPAAQLTEEQRTIIKSVQICTKELDWEGALAIYQQFPADAGDDWLPCHRAVLNCLCKCLRYEESKTVFENLPSRDVISYNSMLSLLGRLRLTDEVQLLLQRMDSENIARNGVTQCQVITGFAETHHWAEAVELLQQLKSDVSLHESTNWEVAYLVSMTACARANLHEQTRALLDEFGAAHEGRVQNSHYNALLISCGSNGAAADRVFQEMRDVGLRARAPDWRAYLSCHRDDSKGQQLRYQQMRQELPSAKLEETWALLLRNAVTMGDMENAEWIVEEMKSNGCELDSDQVDSVPSLRRAVAMYHKRRRHSELLGTPASIPATGVEEAKAPKSLPDGWQSTMDPSSGRPYYWHIDNPAGTTTWDRPS